MHAKFEGISKNNMRSNSRGNVGKETKDGRANKCRSSRLMAWLCLCSSLLLVPRSLLVSANCDGELISLQDSKYNRPVCHAVSRSQISLEFSLSRSHIFLRQTLVYEARVKSERKNKA